INRKYPNIVAYLFSIAQKEKESIQNYLLAGIMQQNLYHRRFKESIVGRPPVTLKELLKRAKKGKERAFNYIDPTCFPQCSTIKSFGGGQITSLNSDTSPIERDNYKRAKYDKYCHFHKDRGYTTEDCFHLK
ncbi:hypothetical protein Pfo_030760, partial [Paulownia fortunei]